MDRVLIVEDEENISNLLKYAIEKEGYLVDTASDGYEATKKIPVFNPGIILLDIMMPNKDGYQVCREFCRDYPIIMLTARSDIVDKIAGIELGADDYITKPFDIREVMIRIKAVLRRNKRQLVNDIEVAGLKILQGQRRVLLNGIELDLTPTEYNLILLMCSNTNRVFSREELLDKVWGYDFAAETRSVDIHMQRLRKKLGDWAIHIRTVYGIGYQLVGGLKNENKI